MSYCSSSDIFFLCIKGLDHLFVPQAAQPTQLVTHQLRDAIRRAEPSKRPAATCILRHVAPASTSSLAIAWRSIQRWRRTWQGWSSPAGSIRC